MALAQVAAVQGLQSLGAHQVKGGIHGALQGEPVEGIQRPAGLGRAHLGQRQGEQGAGVVGSEHIARREQHGGLVGAVVL